jgi:hypothetical protein
MQSNPKYKIAEQVWTEDAYGRGGVMQGTIVGIQCSKGGNVRYMLSCDQHQCHAHPEEDVFTTQEEAWSNWKDRYGAMHRAMSRHNVPHHQQPEEKHE